MKYTMKINKEDYAMQVINIFSCMYPFSILQKKEKLILAIFMNEYMKMKDTSTKEEIFNHLFSYDFKKDISYIIPKVKGENVSILYVTNYITNIRKKGFFKGDTIPDKYLKLFNNIESEISFKIELKN